MSATDQMRQMLDQLMGTQRNGKLTHINIIIDLIPMWHHGTAESDSVEQFYILGQLISFAYNLNNIEFNADPVCTYYILFYFVKIIPAPKHIFKERKCLKPFTLWHLSVPEQLLYTGVIFYLQRYSKEKMSRFYTLNVKMFILCD